MSRRLVVVESRHAGSPDEVARNIAYTLRCVRHSIAQGESPVAGHLLYTRVLNDEIAEERALGIACHLAWIDRADAVVVYTDLGVSRGMQMAIDHANGAGVPVERRSISGWTP